MMKLTNNEVIEYITNFLLDKGEDHDWDDFTSIPIDDDFLNNIRSECREVYFKYPAKNGMGYCNEDGVKYMRLLLQKVKNRELNKNNKLINLMGGSMTEDVSYVSGMGKESTIPPEIKGWNWGAFLLNWIWGIGNSTYIALLMFIPFVNIVMLFVLGAKGNEWAWRNRTWRDVDHFKAVQKKWRNAALIIFFVVLPLFSVGISGVLKGESFDLSLAEIKENSDVIELIGTPMDTGFFVTGSVSTNGPTGEASLQYSISGPKGNAEAYVFAYKKFEQWHLYEVVVIDEDTEQLIHVVTPAE